MDAYSKGLTSRQALFAAKKCKSHRRVPDNGLEEIRKKEEEEKQK